MIILGLCSCSKNEAPSVTSETDSALLSASDESSNASGNITDHLKNIPPDCDQLILTVGEGDYDATIYCFERESNIWTEKYVFAGFIGKNGLGKTAEGDMKSPSGYYSLGTAFGRIENPGTKMPFRLITKNDYWDDDVESATYNTWQTSDPPQTEKMDIPAYNYGFVINYNPECTKGLGSAIFFHCAESYTAGCTGTAQDNVIAVLQWLDPDKNPIICQCYRDEMDKY